MTTEEKCQVIVTATFNPGGNHTPEFQEYSPKAAQVIQAHGGSIVGRLKVEQNAGNGTTPQVGLLVEFPNRVKAEAAFASDEYQQIIPLREVAFSDINILITSSM